MGNWKRTFLKRLEQELEEYRQDGIFLEEEGQNPDTLRQLFDLGEEKARPVVTDIAVFTTDAGEHFLQIYTEIALEVEADREGVLLPRINALNLPVPLGAFGFFREEGQLYHKYSLLVEEPDNLEKLVKDAVKLLDLILGIVGSCYEELYTLAKEEKQE